MDKAEIVEAAEAAWPSEWQAQLSDSAWRKSLAHAISERDEGALHGLCQATMGLEIHLRLATGRKLFCALPSDQAGWVDVGYPGALPSLDPQAQRLATRLGACLGASIEPVMGFERKRYAYPDLSKGYQTTQKALCVWTGGCVDFESGSLRLERAQIEEDAAKVKRLASGGFELDFGRAGSPLLEVVSLPQALTPKQAAQAAKSLWVQSVHCGSTEGLIQEGHFKTDINVSLAPKGASGLGLRVEVKGVGSFEFVKKAALECLWMLAQELLAARPKCQRTMGYSEESGALELMREKASDTHYKFLPEGDLRLRPGQVPDMPWPSWTQARKNWDRWLDGKSSTMDLWEDPMKTKTMAQAMAIGGLPSDGVDAEAASSFLRSFWSKAKRQSGEGSLAGSLAWAIGALGRLPSVKALEIALGCSGKSGFDMEKARMQEFAYQQGSCQAEQGRLMWDALWSELIESDSKAAESARQCGQGKPKAAGYARGAMGAKLKSKGLPFDAAALTEWVGRRCEKGE